MEKDFAHQVVEYRQREGISQEELAGRLGITRNYVSMIEGGKKTASEQLQRSFALLQLSPIRAEDPLIVREDGADYGTARENLRRAREQRGLDFPELAKLTRLKSTYLRDLEEGRASLTEATARTLAETLQIPVADLTEGSEHSSIIDLAGRTGPVGTTPNITLPHGKSARFVPRLSAAQAGALQEWTDDLYDYDGIVAMNLPPKTRAFALTVRGDSMEPRFFAGDEVIVLWKVEPRNGQVVAACAHNGEVMCKLYSTSERGQRITLTSYNPLHPPIQLQRDELRWVFPVHSFNRQVMHP